MDEELLQLLSHTAKNSIQFYWYSIILILSPAHYCSRIAQVTIICAGFIQPDFLERMVLSDDPSGFVDRQLFHFPLERDVYLDNLKVPLPDDVTELERILKVYTKLITLCPK